MHTLTSPDGTISCHLTLHNDNTLTYSVNLNQLPVLGDSPLGLSLKGKSPLLVQNIRLTEETRCDKEEPLLWGQFRTIRDHHNFYRFQCTTAGGSPLLFLEFKLYDGGLAFRYGFSDDARDITMEEDLTGFNLAKDLHCSFTRGERAPEEAKPFSQCDFNVAPVPSNLPVIAHSAQSEIYLALYESAPVNFSQMYLEKDPVNDYTLRCCLNASDLLPGDEAQSMPWRIVLASHNPGDFLTSPIALNLAEPCRLKDTSWIKPGKSTWDWRVHGASYEGFTYGINTASMKRLVDFSSENGYPYFLLDGGWYSKEDPLTPCDDVDIEELVAYARKKDVSPLFYYDLNYTNRGVEEIDFDFIARTYKQMGAGGIKYGFLGGQGPKLSGQAKSAKTIEVIETCAKYKLLADFHDNPIPMVGIERTWPNAITREFCHAQQDCRRGYDSNEFIRMAWINALMGPMDQANGVYAIEDVVRRDRGAKNGIASTVAAETARMGLIFSGLVTLPDAPEEYRKRGDIFSLIKDAPTTWEESRFVEGTFGEYLVVARRTGSTWYVFAANNETARDVTISLMGFGFAAAVIAEMGKDAPQSHFRDNPGAYLVEKKTFDPEGTIQVWMAPGGGFTIKMGEEK